MARRSMLRLRGHVMRSINSALDDSSRVVKDEVLVAVILLARSDAIYGSREAGLSESCPVHMTGVMDMVNMRGGLSELGFDGVVEAFGEWNPLSSNICLCRNLRRQCQLDLNSNWLTVLVNSSMARRQYRRNDRRKNVQSPRKGPECRM